MKKVIVLGISLIVLFNLSCSKKVVKAGSTPYFLVLKYEKGKAYLYSSSTNTTTTMEMGGMSPTVDILTDVKFTIHIEDIKEDTLFVNLKIEDLSMTMRQATVYKNIPDVGNLKGKEVRFGVLKNGKPVLNKEFKGPEKDRLEEIIKGTAQMFSFFPPHPVKVGETWIDTTEEGVYTYVLKDVKIEEKDTIAIIGMQFKINQKREEERNSMKINSKLKGSGDGKIEFSISKGIVLRISTTAGLEGKAHMEGGMLGEGMDLPIYLDQRSETKLVKEE